MPNARARAAADETSRPKNETTPPRAAPIVEPEGEAQGGARAPQHLSAATAQGASPQKKSPSGTPVVTFCLDHLLIFPHRAIAWYLAAGLSPVLAVQSIVLPIVMVATSPAYIIFHIDFFYLFFLLYNRQNQPKWVTIKVAHHSATPALILRAWAGAPAPAHIPLACVRGFSLCLSTFYGITSWL